MSQARIVVVAAWLALILASSGCGLALATQHRPSRRLVSFGFNSYVTRQNLAMQRRVGLPIRRLFVYWSQVEPAAGRWTWEHFDAEYRAVLAARLRPLIVTVGSPCWARPNAGCDDARYTGLPAPQFDPQWAEFIRILAARYPRIVGLEVWNEPNLVQFSWPHVDPIRYARVLNEAYTAVKAVRQRLPVVSGGLAATAGEGGNVAAEGDATFLRSVYGAGGRMDAIGIHPYPIAYDAAGRPLRWDPAAMEQTLERIRAVRAGARARQPLWITEVGASTAAENGYPPAASPALQAEMFAAMAHAARTDPDVTVMLFHTIRDGDPPPLVAQFEAVLGRMLAPLLRGSRAAPEIGTLVALLLERLGVTPGVETGFGVFTASGAAKPAAGLLARLAREEASR